MKKCRHPHPPRFLCNNVYEWAFGIISPSRLLHYTMGGGNEREREVMEKYNARVRAYMAYLHWKEAKDNVH